MAPKKKVTGTSETVVGATAAATAKAARKAPVAPAKRTRASAATSVPAPAASVAAVSALSAEAPVRGKKPPAKKGSPSSASSSPLQTLVDTYYTKTRRGAKGGDEPIEVLLAALRKHEPPDVLMAILKDARYGGDVNRAVRVYKNKPDVYIRALPEHFPVYPSATVLPTALRLIGLYCDQRPYCFLFDDDDNWFFYKANQSPFAISEAAGSAYATAFVARLLSEFGDSIDVNSFGRGGPKKGCALYYAALFGFADVVRLLLDFKSGGGGVSVDNEEALAAAAMRGSLEIVDILLKASAAAAVTAAGGMHAISLAGRTEAFHQACGLFRNLQWSEPILEMLLSSGVDLTAPCSSSEANDGVDGFNQAIDVHRPLHCAAAYGSVRLFETLITHYTAATAVVVDGGSDGNPLSGTSVATAIAAAVSGLDSIGRTLLHSAARVGNVAMVRHLLAKYVKSGKSGSKGAAPLPPSETTTAAADDFASLLRCIDIDAVCAENGYTALYYAADYGHVEATRALLVEGGANPLLKVAFECTAAEAVRHRRDFAAEQGFGALEQYYNATAEEMIARWDPILEMLK